MKNILLIFILFPLFTFAQSDVYRELYQERANNNLDLLAKDESIRKYVKITDLGIEMYSRPNASLPEFRLYWYEASDFLKKFERYSYAQMKAYYLSKGRQKLRLSEDQLVTNFSRFTPESVEQLSIAIDPGHFAGSWEEAVQERKYIKVKGSDVGQSEDIKFYEAELNMATALLVKKKLEALNVERVFITREPGKSAVGKPFDQWYKEDFIDDTKMLVAAGELPESIGKKLLATKAKYPAFKYVYSYLDFVNRSRSINDFHPNVTLIQHYNASEYGDREEEGYWPTTELNYSMAFVPGSFLDGELRKIDARIEFMRLLISPDLEESVRLGKHLISGIDAIGVPPMPVEYESEMIKNNCIASGQKGIYARNLYLTRAIESPVIYIENLFQDNVDELKKLNDKSITIGEINTSKRVEEVAQAQVDAILNWLDENKRLKQQWVVNN